MSGLRASPDCWPRRPGAAAYVLNSDAKLLLFSLTAKKIKRNFQEIFDFVDTQRVTKGDFSGVSEVKRFNGIILYIRYPAGVPYLAPYLIRAGQVSGPERRTDTRSKAAPY